MNARILAGGLFLAIGLTPLVSRGQNSVDPYSPAVQAGEKDEESRLKKASKLFGKLIPGNRKKNEERIVTVPASGNGDGALVIPDPSNPVVPNPGPQTGMPQGGRIPPPPVPASVAPVTLGPPQTANPGVVAPSNRQPAVSEVPVATEPKRGLLSGVTGVVGKIIPGGNDDRDSLEMATQGPAEEDERGFIGRIINRNDDQNVRVMPVDTAPAIPPPPPPPAVVTTMPPVAPANPAVGEAPKQRLTISLRDGHPEIPIQRREPGSEREPESPPAPVSSIEPVMPVSSVAPPVTTAPQLGQPSALQEDPFPRPEDEAQMVTAPITPTVPASRLTQVPPEAVPSQVDQVAEQTQAAAPVVAVSRVGQTPPAMEATASPAEIQPISPPPVNLIKPANSIANSDSGVAPADTSPESGISFSPSSEQPAPSQSVVAIVEGNAEATGPQPGDSGPTAQSPAAMPVKPDQPEPSPQSISVPAPQAAVAGQAPGGSDASGGTHFVTVRNGVSGVFRDTAGRNLRLESGSVMRFLASDDKVVKVRLPDGSEGFIEIWQVRDATFDEAVEFLTKGD